MVPDAAWLGSDQRPWGTAPAAGPTHGVWFVVSRPSAALHARCPGPLGSCSPGCPLGALCCACGDPGHLAAIHRCARPVRCVACALSWATWLQFTSSHARFVVLRVRYPGPLGSCSLVRTLVSSAVCAVSPATCLLFTGVPARCAVLPLPCPLPLGPLFTTVPARCIVLRARCPGPLGSCSPVCSLGALCCVCSVLGHLVPVHRCARPAWCVACAVSWTTWLLFTDVQGRCGALRVPCPGALGCCSPVCSLGVLWCECGVPGHLTPVHRHARSACCVACAVSWAT